MSERVILVDGEDNAIGTADKLEAHRKGQLHRAFSVFVLDDAGRMLLQRRAEGKYHSGGLWSNACCSHPRPGEATEDAAARRLVEEMGIDCRPEPAFELIYRADVGRGLVEYQWTGEPSPDPEEVSEWRWVPLSELKQELALQPRHFTYWFRVAMLELEARDLLEGAVDRVA
jgi:isopentenyl-diphosphate delta-isomerase